MEQSGKPESYTSFSGQELRRNRCAAANSFYDLIREKQLPQLDGKINPARAEFDDPAELTHNIKQLARKLGAGLVGIAWMNHAHVHTGKQVAEKLVISLAMGMDANPLDAAPGELAETEVARVNYELGNTVIIIAQHIRDLGYPATVHHPYLSGSLLHQPFAVAAGLGELGRNGLVITRQFGPRLRLASISTDLPLLVDEPVQSGVAEYCDKCQVCLRACPTGAIARERREVRGVIKYAIDGTRCRPHTLSNHGCAVCIKVCVLNTMAQRHRWLKPSGTALIVLS